MSAGVAFAQTVEQSRKDAKAEVKQEHKADKAQAKAGKTAHKALESHKVKKAAEDQDKANQQASRKPK